MCRREEESQEHTRARVLLVAWVDGWKMMLDGWMEGQLCVCSCPHAVNPLPKRAPYRHGVTAANLHVSHLARPLTFDQPHAPREKYQGQLPRHCLILSRLTMWNRANHFGNIPRSFHSHRLTDAQAPQLSETVKEPVRPAYPASQSHHSGTRTIGSPTASSKKPSPLTSLPGVSAREV